MQVGTSRGDRRGPATGADPVDRAVPGHVRSVSPEDHQSRTSRRTRRAWVRWVDVASSPAKNLRRVGHPVGQPERAG